MRYLLALLLLPSFASAQYRSCGSYSYVAPYQQQTYVQAYTPTYAALAVPLFVTPYAAGYLPAQSAIVTQQTTQVAAAPAHDCKAENAALRAEFNAFKSGFAAALQPAQAPQPQRQMSPARAWSAFTEQDAQEITALITNNCLKCHNQTKAEGGLRLDVEITLPVAIRCQSQVAAGLMPKGGPDLRSKLALFEKLTAKICEQQATAGR